MTVKPAGETTGGPASGLPELRQGRAVSADLRGMAVAAVVERGMSAAAAARHFGLGAASVRNWVRRFRERGHVRPDRQGGSASRIEPERERIFRILEARPAISVRKLRDALAAEGLVFGFGTVQRFLKRHGLERDRRPACPRESGGPRSYRMHTSGSGGSILHAHSPSPRPPSLPDSHICTR